MADRPIIRWSHCGNTIFSLSLPTSCPVCSEDLSGSRLDEAPILLPPPFCCGHTTSCCLLVTGDIEGTTDLHTGISDTKGVVYNYTRGGVMRDLAGWGRCLSVPLVPPDMFNLRAQWNHYLDQFSSGELWDPAWHRFDEDGHNCLTFCLKFINGVLATQQRPLLRREQLTQSFILPRVRRASKYNVLCQRLLVDTCYILERKDARGAVEEDTLPP